MIEINNIWNVIKNIAIIFSIIMNITIIVFVLIVLTHKISININESGEATTTEDVPLKMPISFDMGAIKNKGDANVVIPNQTRLPVKIQMTVPLLEAIRIKNNKQIETTVKDTTKTNSILDVKDTTMDAKETAIKSIKDAKDTAAKSIKDAKDTEKKSIKEAKDKKLQDLSNDK
jgi:hypothetical protein